VQAIKLAMASRMAFWVSLAARGRVDGASSSNDREGTFVDMRDARDFEYERLPEDLQAASSVD
jgi:hypothetical protein